MIISTQVKFFFLFLLGIFLCKDVRPQTGDTTGTINFPLPYEDFSLYDFAEVRFETNRTEIPPANLVKKKFQPLKEIYRKDSLYYSDSILTVLDKFKI